MRPLGWRSPTPKASPPTYRSGSIGYPVIIKASNPIQIKPIKTLNRIYIWILDTLINPEIDPVHWHHCWNASLDSKSIIPCAECNTVQWCGKCPDFHFIPLTQKPFSTSHIVIIRSLSRGSLHIWFKLTLIFKYRFQVQIYTYTIGEVLCSVLHPSPPTPILSSSPTSPTPSPYSLSLYFPSLPPFSVTPPNQSFSAFLPIYNIELT